jgi:hypothetical protein
MAEFVDEIDLTKYEEVTWDALSEYKIAYDKTHGARNLGLILLSIFSILSGYALIILGVGLKSKFEGIPLIEFSFVFCLVTGVGIMILFDHLRGNDAKLYHLKEAP